MLDNVGRKITLILVLLLTSVVLLVYPDKPFNLGLDIQGGLRLVYRFDFEEAVRIGAIPSQDLLNKEALLEETISITRERVDPTGVLEVVVRAEGSDRMVVELPGLYGGGGEGAASSQAADIDENATELELEGADPTAFEGFPEDGGRIRVGDETVFYGRRLGATLMQLRRGQDETLAKPHPAGTPVVMDSRDPILESIESLGDLSFQIVALAGDFDGTTPKTDLTTEETKMRDWAAANPGVPLVSFNRLPFAEGGPTPELEWYPMGEEVGREGLAEVDRAVAILRPPTPEHSFRGSDLLRASLARDNAGFPAVGFEFQDIRKNDFLDFTEKNGGRGMAIILNDEIHSAPTINEPLDGQGIIRGQFTDADVKALIRVLRSGSLRIRPELEHKEQVGPTLGRDYVHRGMLSGILAIALVLGFMIVYYRGLGLYAALSMLAAFTMLMAGLAFLNATLTLPGVAGIILTIGMAVDANILIFDRIREEVDKGRNTRQAAKTGFEKALSAILDANITTLLTAIILYNVGTGPVRGFAVTLMVGIICAVFAALVITRVLVHYDLVRGRKEYKVGRWMVKANYDFLSKTRIAIPTSLVLIVAGLTLFFALPRNQKLGIQFTGGAEVRVRCAEAESEDTIRSLIGQSEYDFVANSEVKSVIESESDTEDGKYTDFSLVFKVSDKEDSAGAESSGGRESRFEQQILEALASVLVHEGVEVDFNRLSGSVNATLAFFENHPDEDIRLKLSADTGLRDVEVTGIPGRQNSYTVMAMTAAGRDPVELVQALRHTFKGSDSAGTEYRLATPIASSSSVGPQVVGELRDKALLALAFSLFVVVLYIRVRFAEYSYGFAAVAAVLHDVLITLGVLMLMNWLGLINGEISLPMIAAFLTIIGYSLNDTIVIFDRVRENLPRMKAPLRDVLNASINQTLSRTILTSVTTFMAVATLYVFNFGTGNVLESFAFAMMVGVITGTYSTIFIANPTLLYLEAHFAKRRKHAVEKGEGQPAKSGAGA